MTISLINYGISDVQRAPQIGLMTIGLIDSLA